MGSHRGKVEISHSHSSLHLSATVYLPAAVRYMMLFKERKSHLILLFRGFLKHFTSFLILFPIVLFYSRLLGLSTHFRYGSTRDWTNIIPRSSLKHLKCFLLLAQPPKGLPSVKVLPCPQDFLMPQKHHLIFFLIYQMSTSTPC